MFISKIISKIKKKFLKKKIIKKNDIDFANILVNKKNKFLNFIIAILYSKTKEGNTCLPIKYILKIIKKEIKQNNEEKITIKNISNMLLKHNIISDYRDKKKTPIIIFNNRMYLHKIWKIEKKIAIFLKNNKEKNYINYNKLKIILNNIFSEKNKHQKLAITLALTQKISFIIGEPGTGKTTLIKKILISLIYSSKKKINIKLATPTGKSAARLTESINKNIGKHILKINEIKKFPQKAYTIHSLLGLDHYKNYIHYKKKNILNIDVLILDESSMIDIQMMSNIISAIPIHTKIIFIGDKNQLNPIGIGNILSDICEFKKLNTISEKNSLFYKLTKCKIKYDKNYICNKLHNNIYILKKNYRFEKNSNIEKLAKFINSGNMIEIKNLLKSNTKNIKLINLNKKNNYLILINSLIKRYIKTLKMLKNKKSIINIINNINKYQLICALKTGEFSVKNINKNIKKNLIKKQLIKNKKNKWYIGQPIIITKNNYNLKIYNGNIGIVLLDDKKIPNVFFKNENNIIKKIPIEMIKYYRSAWAITVHKAQGSEFNNVGLILPNKHIPILTKKLIYTAITRARKKILIYSNKKILYKSIKFNEKRYTGLIEQINNKYIK